LFGQLQRYQLYYDVLGMWLLRHGVRSGCAISASDRWSGAGAH